MIQVGSIASRSYSYNTPNSAQVPQTNDPNSTVKLQQKSEDQHIISTYQQAQQKIISHERAHMQAGGDLASAASYSYSKGPDGKMYITGGEVSVSMREGKTPEETIRIMDQVQRAALAPPDPSPQDIRVATQAASRAMEARSEVQLQKQQENNPYTSNKDVMQGLFSQISYYG